MVQLSTPWGDPYRGMGPPWGAFCQITLTSCFIFLTTAQQRIFGHLSAFLIQSTADLYRSWQNDWHRRDNASTTFWNRIDILIWKSGFESWFFVEILVLAEVTVRLATVPEWPGSSRNWPTVSRVPGEAHFVRDMDSVLYFVLCLSVTHNLT